MIWRKTMKGKNFGPPPSKGPNPQGIRITMIQIGGLSDLGSYGCPHRETGVKSDIQGISNIQLKGKKFTGVK